MNASHLLAPLVLATVVAGSALAADDASTRKDLTAVIALQGLPCGEVVKVEEKAPNDYVATCKDGNRYRVYVNAEGRVVAQKQ
jgi:hypothetical protein